MRLMPPLVLAGLLWSGLTLAGDAVSPPCLMQPTYLAMSLPDRGLTWLPGGDFNGKCDNVPARGWIRRASGTVDLLVHTDGPEGSGRYWNVTVGVGSKQRTKPLRGVCLRASTVGWRTLQRYSKGPLPWLDDVNGDGRTEFILWDSFPLHEEASMAEFALVGWVYRFVPPDSLVIDWRLSRVLARSLAEEYRQRLDTAMGYPRDLRAQAAEALEKFAGERCSVAHTEAR